MVLNLVLIGLAVALDPLPLTAFMIVLPSKRGVRKGAALTGLIAPAGTRRRRSPQLSCSRAQTRWTRKITARSALTVKARNASEA